MWRKVERPEDLLATSRLISYRNSGIDMANAFDKLPDHLLIEVFVRLPISDWASTACVENRCANLFRSDCLWKAALSKRWPTVDNDKRWPGPMAIRRVSMKRRYEALHVSQTLFSLNDNTEDVDELAGHAYLYLKEQLEWRVRPLPYGLLHGMISDQFIACGKARDAAYELASRVWLAVIDNLEENDHTFQLLLNIANQWEVLRPYPPAQSKAVQWRLFERLFTDFRDCLSNTDYYDALSHAKHRFDLIPSTWLGY